MTLRAQGQAVDGPDDEVSFPCTKRSSTSLSKIIPTDLRDLGCSGVAWPEKRPPALRSSSARTWSLPKSFSLAQGRACRRTACAAAPGPANAICRLCTVRTARASESAPPAPATHACPPPGTPNPPAGPTSGGSGPKQLRGGWECPRTPSQRPRCRRSAKSAHGVGHRNPLRAVGLTMSVVFSSHLPIGRMCVVGLAVGGGWA